MHSKRVGTKSLLLCLWKWVQVKLKVLIDNLGVLFINQEINAALIIATKSVYTVWVNDEIPKHCAVPYELCLWKPTREKTVSEFIKTPSQKCKILVMNVEAFSTKKGVNIALSFYKNTMLLLLLMNHQQLKI